MNRDTNGRRAKPQPPIAWNEDEYAGLWTSTADTLDDRVSEDLFDPEDERTDVAIVMHGTRDER